VSVRCTSAIQSLLSPLVGYLRWKSVSSSRASALLLFIISSYTKYTKKRKETTIKTQKTTQTEQQIDYKVRLDGKYKKDTAISLAHAEHFRNCKARFWTLVCVNRNTNYSMCACFTLHSSLLNWDRIWNRIRLISWMPKDTAIGVLTMFTCVRIDIASETWSATVGVHERIVLHTFAARRKVITMSLHWLFVATRYSQQYTSLIRVGYVHCLKKRHPLYFRVIFVAGVTRLCYLLVEIHHGNLTQNA